MEFLVLGRVLGRRRWMLALGAIVSIALAVAIGSSPPTASSVATTRLLLDTPRSQEVEIVPFGVETLPWRASLLSHLMADEANKRRLARAVGIPADQLYVEDAALIDPAVTSSLPKGASEVAAISNAPYALQVGIPNDTLPIINLTSGAPDRRSAVRLVEAARDLVRSAVPSPDPEKEVKPGTRLSEGDAADSSQPFGYLVKQIAPIRAKTVLNGRRPLKAILAAGFVFCVWCGCVVVLPGLVRRVRRLQRLQEPVAAGR